jgi:predicted Zn-dependent protease
MKSQYGQTVVTEGMINDVGYTLMGGGQTAPAVAAFQLNVAEHPQSGNAWDSMGEAYATTGDKKKAIDAYTKAAALDTSNANAKAQIQALKHPPKKAKKK